MMQNQAVGSINLICVACYILQRDPPFCTPLKQRQCLRRSSSERLEKMTGGQNLFPQTHTQEAGCGVLSFFKPNRYPVVLLFRVIPPVPRSFDLDKVMCKWGPYFSWSSGEKKSQFKMQNVYFLPF